MRDPSKSGRGGRRCLGMPRRGPGPNPAPDRRHRARRTWRSESRAARPRVKRNCVILRSRRTRATHGFRVRGRLLVLAQRRRPGRPGLRRPAPWTSFAATSERRLICPTRGPNAHHEHISGCLRPRGRRSAAQRLAGAGARAGAASTIRTAGAITVRRARPSFPCAVAVIAAPCDQERLRVGLSHERCGSGRARRRSLWTAGRRLA